MSYTSKYTAEQIEDKLTEVFDSTLQTKEIELTSNGTTELIADAGFLGLKSVTVKTNVPQSGGSGGSEASSMEYLDISSLNLVRKMMFLNLCVVAKFAESIISPFAYLAARQTDLLTTATDATMVAIDFGAKVYNDTLLTVKEVLFSPGFNYTEEELAAIPRITEEEFYNLNVGTSSISFTINGTSYQAEEGMTWGEWVNSSYNTDGYINNTYIQTPNWPTQNIALPDSTMVGDSQSIIAETNYILVDDLGGI